MRRMTKVVGPALVGVLLLSGCSEVNQDAIAAEAFSAETINDPKIPIGPGGMLTVEAGDFFFNVDGTAVDGEVVIEFLNVGGAEHNFRIDEAAGETKLVEALGGQEATGSLLLFGGTTYTYYCDIPGHRANGMEGTLQVLLPGQDEPMGELDEDDETALDQAPPEDDPEDVPADDEATDPSTDETPAPESTEAEPTEASTEG